MRRLALAFALLVVPATPALAQTASQVATEVEFRGYYVEPGLDVSIDRMEDLAGEHPEMGFVALDQIPPGGADLFADEVLALLSDRQTVIVLTVEEWGASSRRYSNEAVDRAGDDAFATLGDDYETDFEQLASALAGEPAAGTGSGGLPLGTILLVLAVGGVAFLMWRNSRRDQAAAGRRLEEAKAEIRGQMDVLANQILDWSDRVDANRHPEAVEHFRRASDTFHDAESRLAEADTPEELERLADDLDDARWEMAAVEAIVAGREVPPRPDDAAPEPCFFDPTHGAGVEEAELRTPAGTRKVMVCTEDAERLRRGERPEPRSIDVGGRQIPAPQAPRTYGGRGFDWLDAFSILVGGMGGAMDYRWGRPRRPSWGGGFGFPGSGGRPPRMPRPSVGRGRGRR